MHFHVDAVKQLLGKLTAFPVTFFFLNSKTHWANSCKLWTKTFSAQARVSWHMFKLRAWTFCNERHEVLLYLQSSTGINSERNSRKKRARKKRKAVPLEAKQEVKQAHSNQRTWPCSSSSLILCHFWTRKRFPFIVDSASLTGQVFQYIVSGSIRAKSPVHGFRDYVRLKQSN